MLEKFTAELAGYFGPPIQLSGKFPAFARHKYHSQLYCSGERKFDVAEPL